MRQTLRIVGIGFWSLLSLDLVGGILDWLGRWDVFVGFMASHPHVAGFVRTPFVYVALLILGFLFLRAEQRLKVARINARLTNGTLVPRLKTVSLRMVFDEEAKHPGWDQHTYDWDWFLEVALANDAETKATVDEVRVKLGGPRNWFGLRKALRVQHITDFSDVEVLPKGGPDIYNPSSQKLPNLMEKIKGVPLEKGIGYRGWLCFHVPQISRRTLNKSSIRVWLVDALQGQHEVHYKRGSDKTWKAPTITLKT